MFQSKTRSQRGQSVTKLRAVLHQSALRRSERLQPLTGNEQTKNGEATSWEGGRRRRKQEDRSLCWGGGEEKLWAHGLSPHDTVEETRKQGKAAPGSIHLDRNQFIQQQKRGNLPRWRRHRRNSHRPISLAFCVPVWAAEMYTKMCWNTLLFLVYCPDHMDQNLTDSKQSKCSERSWAPRHVMTHQLLVHNKIPCTQ